MQFVKTRQKNNQAEIQIGLLSKGIEDYKLDNGDYPGAEDAGGSSGEDESNMLFKALYWDSDDDGNGMPPGSPDEDQIVYLSELDPLNDAQKWTEGSGEFAEIIDPWENEYRYRRGSGALNPDYDLWSMGKDEVTAGDGTDDKDKDDIRNF